MVYNASFNRELWDYEMTITSIVIYSLIGIGLIYDAYALSKDYQNTISWTLYNATKRWPIIGVLLGIVIGHLFFPISSDGKVCP